MSKSKFNPFKLNVHQVAALAFGTVVAIVVILKIWKEVLGFVSIQTF